MNVYGVNAFAWNPRRKRLPYLRPRHNNFGDLLGPLVVRLMVEKALGRSDQLRATATGDRTLLTVGSVMHFAQDGDVVWGTGVNGKVRLDEHLFSDLSVRAVRGPRTRRWLMEHKSIEAPEVYGDPALLLPSLRPDLVAAAQQKSHSLTVIPNMNEMSRYRKHPAFFSPRRAVERVLLRIARSEAVVGSSLHAVILAEALGVPAALVRSQAEAPLKYADYFEGTGRPDTVGFDDLDSAINWASSHASRPTDQLAGWDSTALSSAFPVDLWTPPSSR